MSQVRLAQAVGQRTPNPALPASYLQQTSQRVSYPLFLSTQIPQRIESVEKAQQKQSGPLQPQGQSPKLLNKKSYVPFNRSWLQSGLIAILHSFKVHF